MMSGVMLCSSPSSECSEWHDFTENVNVECKLKDVKTTTVLG